jgi:hypothetical protein
VKTETRELIKRAHEFLQSIFDDTYHREGDDCCGGRILREECEEHWGETDPKCRECTCEFCHDTKKLIYDLGRAIKKPIPKRKKR